MLSGIFKRNPPATPILILVLGLLLWSDAFLFSDTLPVETNRPEPLYRLVFALVSNFQLLNIVFAFILLLLQVVILNQIVQANNMLAKPSWLPGFWYLLLMSINPAMLNLNPALIANFFLLIALARSMVAYNEGEAIRETFDAGLLIALAGLFYYPAMVFILWPLFVLITYFLLSVRGIVATFLGFFTPFFFIFLYFFLTDQLPREFDNLPGLAWPPEVFLQPLPPAFIIIISFVALISIVAFFRLLFVYITDKPVRIRKRFSVVVQFFLFSGLSAFAENLLPMAHISLMMLPLGIALAVLTIETKRRWLADLVIYLFIGLVVAGKVFEWV